MAVFCVGGESECYDLPSGHNYSASTNPAHFDNALSRGAMAVTTGTSELILPFNQTGGVDEVYIHFVLYQENVTSGNYIDIQNEAQTQTQYRVVMNADATWTIQRYDGTNFVDLGTTSQAMAQNELITVDIHILRNNTTGVVEVYRNNVSVLNVSNVDTSTPATMGAIHFIGLAGSNNRMMISQVIVGDQSFLNWKLCTLAPTGNGTHTDFTGDYTAIDEPNIVNTADYIETNSTQVRESFVHSGIPTAYSTYNVKGVVVAGHLSNDSGSAVNDDQFMVRTNSNDYDSPNLSVPKTGAMVQRQYIWENNPATSNPWTVSEVQSMEFGVKSV